MSTLESQSGPADFVRRNRTGEVALPGVQGSLDAPGLAVPPPVSPAAESMDRIINAFSSLGGLSSQLAYTRHRQEAREEQRAELAKQQAEEVAAAERGQANLDAASDMPDLLSRIEAGQIRPDEGEDTRSFVQRIVLAGTEEMSEAYREQRREKLTGHVANALDRRVQRNKQLAQADNAGLVVQSIDGATSGADFDAAVTAFRKFMPDASENVAAAEVGKRWLDNAVATAAIDPDRAAKILTAARAKLGDRLQTEQIKAQADYDTALLRNESRVIGELQSDVGKMLDAGAPFPTVLSFIEQEGKKLGVDVHALLRQTQTEHEVVHNRRKADANDARRQADEAARAAEENVVQDAATKLLADDPAGAEKTARSQIGKVRSDLVLQLVERARAYHDRAARVALANKLQQEETNFQTQVSSQALGMAKAGQLYLVGDARAVLSDGTEVKLTRNEIREAAMTERFAEIAKANPDDREAAEDQMVDAAAENAYYPAGWKNLIEGAAGKTTVTAIANYKDGKIPADVTEGYRFFKKLTARSPGLLDSMGLDARTRRLFTAAMELEKVPAVGADPMTALRNAADVVDRSDTPLDTMRFSALAAELDVATQSDRETAREAWPIAEILVRLGKTPEAAVSQAVEQVGRHRVVINGWSSRLGNVPEAMRYQFADVAEDRLAEYADAELKDTGIDKGDLAFRYDSNTDRWQIVMRDTGLLVPTNNPDRTIFFTDELINAATKKEASTAKQKYLERQRAAEAAMEGLLPENTHRMDLQFR